MDEQRWRSICAAFDEVLELERDAQVEFLARLNTTDSALCASVEKLLAYDSLADTRVGALTDLLEPRANTPDALALIGRNIAHFRIIEPIASGGMGVVYRAQDLQLRRVVALKLPLPGQQIEPAARARFLREGQAAGRLDHPNICTIHEVGESIDGYLFIAMTLYDGETLRQRLDRVRTLTIADALAIARDIAIGLTAAHASGVVHRDLKPANVMLVADGGVRILDFGLAHSRDATQSLTFAKMGTVSYMAPEQVSGSTADARVDLWSLGVMLHEMLVGERPFAGEHPVAVAHAILHDQPPRPRRVRPEVSWRLDALVQRLLQKAVDARPASATTVVTELEAIIAGGAATLSTRVRVGALRALHRQRRVLMLGMIMCVGVLGVRTAAVPGAVKPVHDATTANRDTRDAQAWEFYHRAQIYAARGPSDENLSSARGLYERAIARDSTFALAHARLAVTLFTIAGNQEAEDSGLIQRVQHASQMAVRLRPDLPEAHLALGYHWIARGQNARALEELERAAAGMPNSAEPAMQMAIVHRREGRWRDAKLQLQRAAAAEPANVDVLLQLATTHQRMREYAEAVAIWDRLIVLEPDAQEHKLTRGYLFTRWRGNPDTLSATLERIPASWDEDGKVTMARFLVARLRRRPADALLALQRSRATVMRDPFIHRPRTLLEGQIWSDLGDAKRARERFAAAVTELELSMSASPRDYRIRVALGEAYAGAGQGPKAIAVARQLVSEAATMQSVTLTGVMLLGAAEIYARAGATSDAIALLDRLLDMNSGREATVPIFRTDPTWDSLRDDPRFGQMLERERTLNDR
ncbi:MAG: protein kinase [Gemmatimonadaceae bacterium]|nr:protein kinase [Gemmatimonadaceae bacterium]